MDPLHHPLHMIAEPETQTFNDFDENQTVEMGFEIDPSSFQMNLASRRNEIAKDPLADIKRRERDLQHERTAREAELQREYEKRLQEFELDFQQKERELEKEKLY